MFFFKKKKTFFSLESTWSFQDVTQTWEWNRKKRQNDINWNLLDSYARGCVLFSKWWGWLCEPRFLPLTLYDGGLVVKYPVFLSSNWF